MLKILSVCLLAVPMVAQQPDLKPIPAGSFTMGADTATL